MNQRSLIILKVGLKFIINMPMKKNFLQEAKITIEHYEREAEVFWQGTRDHDVSQNYDELLKSMKGDPPFTILDFGCGPGRDLNYFRSLGHNAIGLEGSKKCASMAEKYSGCEVLLQNFLSMNLPNTYFDGIFANAALFHVPSLELPRILNELFLALKPKGVLFSSNPHGNNEEGFNGDRYGCFHDLQTWQEFLITAGFSEIKHYFRPPNVPRYLQPWLATIWRKN